MRLKKTPDYPHLCDIPRLNAEKYPNRISHKYRVKDTIVTKTFGTFMADIKKLACAFASHGVKRGDHVAFFADNRYLWAVTDYALMAAGAVSVPRGSDTPPLEQKFLYEHSDSKFLVMENMQTASALINEFKETPFKAEKIFIMDKAGADSSLTSTENVVFYEDIMKDTPECDYAALVNAIKKEDLATIIYTSGTSGNPKGVMLTHSNFLHNVRAITPLLWIDTEKAERTVSILPSWHVYERCFEYCAGAGAMSVLYSSVRTLAADLVSEKPQLVASVPRIWESIYDKMIDKNSKVLMFFLKTAELRLLALNRVKGHFITTRKHGIFYKLGFLILVPFLFFLTLPARLLLGKLRRALGGKLRASFSGGGSLPPQVDLFFNAAGVKLVNAYGMTETSPGTITRRLDRNTLGSIGVPLAETEMKIVKKDGSAAETGEKGTVYVRGPQVMRGYYKNPQATEEVLSPDGWLNTGDTAMKCFSGDTVMTGRAKSTIVLLGGENAEPEPIEEKLQQSHLIEHAVVVGQDKKTLSAVITVKEDQIKKLADKWKISMDELWHKSEDAITHSKIVMEIQKEIKKLINKENGFKPFEKISNFVLVKKKFTVGDELTQTLKVKRKHVEKKYKHLLK